MAIKEQREDDPREVILVGLHSVDAANRGAGLPYVVDHRKAASMARSVFEPAAAQLRMLGLVALTGADLLITDAGRKFVDQRFSREQHNQELFKYPRKVGSFGLPDPDAALTNAIAQQRRRMKISSVTSWLFLFVIFAGVLIYAQTH